MEKLIGFGVGFKALAALLVAAALFAAGCAPAEAAAQGVAAAQPNAAAPAEAVTPEQVARVPVAEARRRVQAGEALLVCAYAGDDKFAAMRLEGAISWNALQAKLPALDKRTEIILYCG
jgi:hypothetical protein